MLLRPVNHAKPLLPFRGALLPTSNNPVQVGATHHNPTTRSKHPRPFRKGRFRLFER